MAGEVRVTGIREVSAELDRFAADAADLEEAPENLARLIATAARAGIEVDTGAALATIAEATSPNTAIVTAGNTSTVRYARYIDRRTGFLTEPANDVAQATREFTTELEALADQLDIKEKS